MSTVLGCEARHRKFGVDLGRSNPGHLVVKQPHRARDSDSVVSTPIFWTACVQTLPFQVHIDAAMNSPHKPSQVTHENEFLRHLADLRVELEQLVHVVVSDAGPLVASPFHLIDGVQN